MREKINKLRPLWLVIEYFMACIGYSSGMKNLLYIYCEFYVVFFRCRMKKKMENSTRWRNPREIGQELTDLVDVENAFNIKFVGYIDINNCMYIVYMALRMGATDIFSHFTSEAHCISILRICAWSARQ